MTKVVSWDVALVAMEIFEAIEAHCTDCDAVLWFTRDRGVAELRATILDEIAPVVWDSWLNGTQERWEDFSSSPGGPAPCFDYGYLPELIHTAYEHKILPTNQYALDRVHWLMFTRQLELDLKEAV